MARYKVEYLSAATSDRSVVGTLLLPTLTLEETIRLAEAHLAAIPGAVAFQIRDMEQDGKIVWPKGREPAQDNRAVSLIIRLFDKLQRKRNA